MNVLAPVARNGRLQVSLTGDTGAVLGFQTGEFRVSRPRDAQAGHARSGRRRDLPVAHPRRGGQPRRRLVSSGRSPRRGWSSCTARRSTRPARRALAPPCSTSSCRSSAPRGGCCATRACAGSSSPPTTGSSCSTTTPAAVQVHGRRVDPQAPARLLAGGRRPRGRGPGRARGPAVRGRLARASFSRRPRRSSTPAGGRWASRTAATACRSASSRCSPWCTARRPAGAASGTASRREAREGVAGMHCVEATVEVLAAAVAGLRRRAGDRAGAPSPGR